MELTDEIVAQASHGEPDSVALPNMNLQKISCSKALANLIRLDLSNNGLQSIKPLSKCKSLKWLSVASNSLQSLHGIEGLPNLTVLNCSCNRLSSIKEVEGLFGLRALIVNDNRIANLCKFQKLTVLSTLVLSKNPISGLTAALESVRSLNKLSLSNCNLQELGSLEQLVELKELRLAHNSLKCLSRGLAKNCRLQILDLGSNLLNDLSDIEVLNTLPYLRNLNVRGNPFCIQAGYEQKIRAWLPALRVLDGHSLNDVCKRKVIGQQSSAKQQLRADTEYLHTTDKVRKVTKEDKVLRKTEDEAHQTLEGSLHKIKKRRKAENAFSNQLIEASVEASRDQTMEGNIRTHWKEAEKESRDHSAAPVERHNGEISVGRQEKKKKLKQDQKIQETAHKIRKTSRILPPADADSEPFLELICQKKPDIQSSRKPHSHGLKKEDSGLVSVVQNQSKFPNLKKSKRMPKTSSAFCINMMDVDIGGGGQSSWN